VDVQVEITGSRLLRFDDGGPVRAASAIALFAPGWLIAQDDSTHAAWWTPRSTSAVRLFPPVEGLDAFSEADGTKALKPDLEAACEVARDGAPGVLFLGSGSTPARMRGALVVRDERGNSVCTADLAPLYQTVAVVLGIEPTEVNIEGSCRLGDRLRLFNRGNLRAGLSSASVDVDLAALVASVLDGRPAEDVTVAGPVWYELGAVDGIGLAVTDAIALPDGTVLISAAAEDTPNAVDDGPVVAAALAIVVDGGLTDLALLPTGDGPAHKVEGLALRRADRSGASLVAVFDADDPAAPSTALDVVIR
jgi:hypothetical protein